MYVNIYKICEDIICDNNKKEEEWSCIDEFWHTTEARMTII